MIVAVAPVAPLLVMVCVVVVFVIVILVVVAVVRSSAVVRSVLSVSRLMVGVGSLVSDRWLVVLVGVWSSSWDLMVLRRHGLVGHLGGW